MCPKHKRERNCASIPVVLPQPLVSPVRRLEGDVAVEELVLPHLKSTQMQRLAKMIFLLVGCALVQSQPSGRFTRFCKQFFESSPCLCGQQGSCVTIVELSENILQNLGNNLMADSVGCATCPLHPEASHATLEKPFGLSL